MRESSELLLASLLRQEIENVAKLSQLDTRRIKRADCPGGTGKYGFNTYNLMTTMVLGFNAVANLYANVNNNDQNNNNNNNDNDFGVVQATSNDVSVSNNFMTLVITIVPPIGPPIPVVMGRALQDGTVYLDERFKRPDIYLENDQTKYFLNGTILHSNGTTVNGTVQFAALDPRNPRNMISLESYLGLHNPDDLNLALLTSLDNLRKNETLHKKKSLQDWSTGVLKNSSLELTNGTENSKLNDAKNLTQPADIIQLESDNVQLHTFNSIPSKLKEYSREALGLITTYFNKIGDLDRCADWFMCWTKELLDQWELGFLLPSDINDQWGFSKHNDNISAVCKSADRCLDVA